jgi:nuclear receptor-binding protein
MFGPLFLQDFIRKCLSPDPKKRPSARELLFHAVLFEVHSLKLLAAHSLVSNATYLEVAENTVDEVAHIDPRRVVATISHDDGREQIRTT